MNRDTILVVDDALENIQLVAKILAETNRYKVVYAENGIEALKRLEKHSVSLILLDIIMPEMDGFAVAERIKNNPKTADIPFIFLTAITEKENIQKSFEIGAKDYITKPFNHFELVARVQTHVQLYKSKKHLKSELKNNIHILQQYKNVVDESDIVSKADPQGNITYINNRFLEISGYSEEELIGRPHNILRHPDMEEKTFATMWKTIKEEKKTWRGEVKNLKKDGKEYIVESTIMPILDLNGEVEEFISTRHDITDIYTLNKEIENTQKEVIFTLGSIGESRSKETANHVKRVAEYSYLLGTLYGLKQEECELLKYASPMHDIGKVATPDSILNKPGKLTKDEFEIMKKHAEIGRDMLNHSERPIFKTAATIAHQHHEKYDGTGYPRGVAGEEIHIYGRITALADVFDALGSDRVYKTAWELERILDLIKEESGKHFDPQLVTLFFNNLDGFLVIRDSLKDC